MMQKTASMRSRGSGSCSEIIERGGEDMPKRNTDENVFVKCPYYKCESQCVIYCEGVEDNCCIHVAFATKPQRREYEKRFCQDCWGKCMIAEAHNRKWGYDA